MNELNFNAVSLIRKKRDGATLSNKEIKFLIDRYTEEALPDYQMSAFLMAAFLNGLTAEESGALTESMLHSGITVDLSEIPGTKVDKHSTGGVGDKLSLILAPVVASAGVPVPMISGRGLGHTGGTLDKLESITGFNVDANLERYKEILAKHNLVLIGQTKEIAPADKKIYALRDVTATVEYIPFIASSIMSKKIAEGIDALVLDVKFGSGAFMKNSEQAIELAEELVRIGERFGKKTIAYVTNMQQPLGNAIGNWLEVKESIEALNGRGPEDVSVLSHLLAGTMIYLGDKAQSVEEGIKISKEQVDNGAAFQKWIDIVEEQGGNLDYIENPGSYPQCAYQFEYRANQEGYIGEMDAFDIGMASLELGAGRKTLEQNIDPSAGVTLNKKVGDFVSENETILTGYTNTQTSIELAQELINSAIHIDKQKPEPQKLVSHVVDRQGVRAFEL